MFSQSGRLFAGFIGFIILLWFTQCRAVGRSRSFHSDCRGRRSSRQRWMSSHRLCYQSKGSRFSARWGRKKLNRDTEDESWHLYNVWEPGYISKCSCLVQISAGYISFSALCWIKNNVCLRQQYLSLCLNRWACHCCSARLWRSASSVETQAATEPRGFLTLDILIFLIYLLHQYSPVDVFSYHNLCTQVSPRQRRL